jgi:hypothetical protein
VLQSTVGVAALLVPSSDEEAWTHTITPAMLASSWFDSRGAQLLTHGFWRAQIARSAADDEENAATTGASRV